MLYRPKLLDSRPRLQIGDVCKVHQVKRIPYAVNQMYGVIADMEQYPEFLPFWSEVQMIDRWHDWAVMAQMIGWFPLQFVLESKVHFEPNVKVDISAKGGPFERLHISWRLKPIFGGNLNSGSEVSLQVFYRLYQSPVYIPFVKLLKQAPKSFIALFCLRLRNQLEEGERSDAYGQFTAG